MVMREWCVLLYVIMMHDEYVGRVGYEGVTIDIVFITPSHKIHPDTIYFNYLMLE